MKSKSQKYEEAISRNLPTFMSMTHRKPFYRERERHMDTSDVVEMVKRAIGIRLTDPRHDDTIRTWYMA